MTAQSGQPRSSLWHRFLVRSKIKQTWPLHLLLLVPIVMVAIFNYGPMVGISIAFQDYMPTKGFFGSPWVGLEHFQYLMKLPDVPQVIKNTVVISFWKLVLTMFSSLLFALLINEVRNRHFKRFSQSVLLFPYFMSWVVLGGIIIDVFQQTGAVNKILTSIGLEPLSVLVDQGNFRYLLYGTNIWKDMGYNMVIFLAAISSIDPALYESAVIDGANRWQQTLHITLPSIAPMIVLLVTLALGGILNAGFDQIFVLYSTPVYQVADIIDTYVYRLGFLSAQYSLATAVGLFKSLVGFVLIIISYWMADRFAGYRIF
ncbi:ABC transporter permease subunit [Eubacteriales bacterium OttesenSCG-928-N13]|nr:ABC transporter permease subunit [Eubacteriales bacterium OttesenSCG-928-N13]